MTSEEFHVPNRFTRSRVEQPDLETPQLDETIDVGALSDEDYQPKSTKRRDEGETEADSQTSKRLDDFLDQVRPNKQRRPNRQDNNSEPSEGRLVGNRLIVDSVRDKFQQNDPYHVSRFIPPGSSTPTQEELLDAISFVKERQQAEAEFYSDPMSLFMINVDGFCNKNGKGSIMAAKGEVGIPISSVYNILARGDHSNRASNPLGAIHSFTLPRGSMGGFGGTVGTASSPINIQRGLGPSPADRGIMTTVRSTRREGELQTMTDTINRTAHVSRVGVDPRLLTYGSESGEEESLRMRGRSSIGGITTPMRGGNYQPSQAGPARSTVLEDVPQISSSLRDEEDVYNSSQPQTTTQQQQSQNIQNTGTTPRTTGNISGSELFRLSQDARSRDAVEKYLSNIRTAQAYQAINRPEITGEMRVTNTVVTAIEFAANQLRTKFPGNFDNCTDADLCTKNIRNLFAKYVQLHVKEIQAESGDIVNLQVTEPRLIEKKYALGNEFMQYSYNSSTQEFEKRRFPNRSTGPSSMVRARIAYENSEFLF